MCGGEALQREEVLALVTLYTCRLPLDLSAHDHSIRFTQNFEPDLLHADFR